MSNITIPANLTGSIVQPSSDKFDNDEDWFIARLISGFIDVILEQGAMNADNWERFGGITTYFCSIYGVSCLAMALVLNRTLIMASTNTSRTQQMAINRNRGILNPHKLAEVLKSLSIVSFRVGMIALLVYHCYDVLVALNLYSHITDRSDLPWFYKLLPDKLFAYDPAVFADNKFMKTPKNQVVIGPTTDMYWPIFLIFCLLQFTETFISVIQGKKPYTESGITIFEHSLAFQEFSSSGNLIFGGMNHERPNEQVLITTLFSLLNHLNIHIGGLISNNKYKLIPLSVFGLGFLTYFMSSIVQNKLLAFPMIVIFTFTPQVLMLSTIVTSLVILLFAMMANGFRLEDLNFANFLLDNESEREFSTRNINITLNDDFYTALSNASVLATTMAGKCSYMSELSLVTLDSETWIERSIWEEVKHIFKIVNGKDPVDPETIISYLKENNITGYANLIAKPSQRLIADIADPNSERVNASRNTSVLKRRYVYVWESVSNLCQLMYGLFISSFLMTFVPSIFNKYILRRETDNAPYVETDEEFELRKQKTPKFLREYLRQRTGPSGDIFTPMQSNSINIDEFTNEQISEDYLEILRGSPISNWDASEDFRGIDELESELESDVESFRDEQFSTLNELISAQELNDMMDGSNINILQLHMNSKQGIMTRSRFEATREQVNPQALQDGGLKLLQLIISKRADHETRIHNDEGDQELSSRFSCVICQTNVREIITWPCKCFAICESCRLSLVAKGIEGCVCCRSDVEGVSKVFIP